MSNVRIDLFIDEFLSELKSVKRYSDNTVTAYEKDLSQFVEFLDEKNIATIRQVSDKTIRHYLIHLNQLELSKSSISRKLSALRSFFDYVILTVDNASNPAKKIKAPKFRRKLPETINLDSFLEIITLIEEDDDPFRRSLNKAIFELLYGCSLRVSEVCNLKTRDVDLSQQTVRLLGKGAKIRIVPLGSKSIEVLQDYMNLKKNNHNSPNYFVDKDGQEIDRWYVYRLVKKYIGKVSDIEKKSPHVLRHSSATAMLNNGADLMAVKEILGHENLSTTQIYTHVSVEQLKKAYKSAHPKS